MRILFILFILAAVNIREVAGQEMVAGQAMPTAHGMPAAGGQPVIGQRCPDVLLTKMEFYKKAEVSLHELEGKWVVLDFWDRVCSSCIGSFPLISELQQRFGDAVQFVMVACDDPGHNNRSVYTAYHDRFGLAMPSAFCGSTVTDGLFKQFNVGATPHIVVVDPSGIVKAVTFRVTVKQMKALIEGGSPSFERAFYADQKKNEAFPYNRKMPFLIYGNGGIDSNFEFRSLLSKWDKRSVAYQINFSGRRLEALGLGLPDLYRMAYMGNIVVEEINRDTAGASRIWPEPVIESTDSLLFIANYADEMNVFDYSLVVPSKRANKDFMLHIMQSDLKHYFGYEASFETQSMPYFKLVVIDTALADKLRTKGGDGKLVNVLIYRRFTGRNVSMLKFKDIIGYMAGLDARPESLVDETGITYNIDVDMDCLKGDFAGVNEWLKKIGLQLVRGMRAMKVLVVGDGKESPGTN
jgi:thiol-disulfide isomerase/thioredoxin